MIIDTHCHVQFKAFQNDYGDVLKRCAAKEVVINTVGTQKDTSRLAVEIAEQHHGVFATIGLHPIHLFATEVDEEESKFLSREEDFDENYYTKLAESPKVVGIGECGLDFFHLPKKIDKEKAVARQKEIFLKQLALAKKLDKTLVIHVREAHQEMAELLKEKLPANSLRGVVHCFTGNWLEAKRYLDLGLYIGFTGVVTFPPKKNNSQPTLDILEVVEKIPLDRVVVETDAPYLAPQAYRGRRCEPWMVEEVIKKIAEVRQMSFSEVVGLTTKNAQNLFKLV